MVIKAKMTVLVMLFAVDEIARSLFLTPDEVLEQFSDARLTGRLAEVWGTRLFGYRRHANSNLPGSDGNILLGPIGRYNISVRAFRRSLKFQQSKFIGSGRICLQEDLVQSLAHVEVVVAVDLRGFPEVRFYPIDSKCLLRLALEGSLTPAGMSAERFDRWVSDSFDIQVVASEVRAA
jgi:hypothetical protein